MSEKIRTNVMLDRVLWRETRRISLEQETSASKIINALLVNFVKEQEKKDGKKNESKK
ncbi:hypothetical protein KKE06_03480 [Candidatus Micrarchaeota archaeon]|nr:hypothetical protein [Candidatus Micrarchaeota archaeon]MBU1930279.1 hypothetical protein [Candidatus Micrarchaeota archaeon]